MNTTQPGAELKKDQDWPSQLVKLLDGLLAELTIQARSDGLLEKIVRSLMDTVDADAGTLYITRPDDGLLEPAVSFAASQAVPAAGLAQSLHSLIDLVGQERRARLVQDYSQWSGRAAADDLPRSALAAPLVLADRLLGVLALASNRSETFFVEADLQVAGLFARLAVLAIQAEHSVATIKRLTNTDQLTGVWTRSQFFEVADLAYRQAVRYQRPLSAIMIDIDRFKMLNEMHGYVVGDLVLGTVARNLVSRLRDSDLLCRYGGEEFVLLLPETDLEHACMAAERMRSQIAAAPTETQKGTFFVTISAGVASLESSPIDQLDRLLNLAEQATRAAKLAGRNRVMPYSEEIEL